MHSSLAFIAAALIANTIAGPVVKRGDDVDAEVLQRRAVTTTTSSPTSTTVGVASTSTSSTLSSTSVQPTTTRPSTTKHTTKHTSKHTTKHTTKKSSTKKTKPHKTTHASAPTASTYIQAVIQHHNYHRANHSAPPLTWSPRMASFAKGIAESCNYAHNVEFGGGGYGQNIAAGASLQDISGVITDQFYNNEVKYYKGLYGTNNPNMNNFEAWGHFSQVVWKSTRQVGCYTIDCSKRKGGLKGITDQYSNIAPLFTVCNYSPPGNYQGEYKNVGKSLNKPTIHGSYRVNGEKIHQINPPPASKYN